MAFPLALSRAARIAAWLGLALVTVVTLSPAALRPHLADPRLEYLVGMAVLGTLFGFAYPRRPLLLVALTIAAVALLELGQMLTGDRHARLGDLGLKALGACAGMAAGLLLARLAPGR